MKIVSSKEMAKIESKAILNGAIDAEFMEEAGLSIARLAHSFIERNDIKKQVTLLCGKGNNAGDAYVAGIHLLSMGYSVDAMQLEPFKNCSQLCQINQTRFFNAGGLVKEISTPDDLGLPLNGLIIDGIFGTGFKGKIKEPIAGIIYKANSSKLPILAIDIPSGLNGDTGVASDQAIIAKETAFLGLPKLGFFLNDGWNHVGKLRYVDFGLPFKSIKDAKTDFEMIEISQMKPLIPVIARSRNKYEAGYVVALAGSSAMPGAAILSTTATLKSGSGIVKLLCKEDMNNALIFSPHELIKIPFTDKDEQIIIDTLNKATAVFIGPGVGTSPSTVKLLKKILPKLTKPSVIDADALNILATNKISLPKNCILTPHKGEMERLLGIEKPQVVNMDFINSCQDFAAKNAITLILKGGPTFIFTKDMPIFINITGDPGMATAGSGDVLTGLLASLLAQGLETHDAALLGTFLHGLAGEIAADEKTSYCMIASDIIDNFPGAFKTLL
jgi:NAD(P)H-hydrate epimerase